MYRDQGRYRFTAAKAAIIGILTVSFLTLTVAGTSAAGVSFFDSVTGFFGLQSAAGITQTADSIDAAQSGVERNGENSRALASTTLE